MKNALFIEFWNCSPHLETTLELIKLHVDSGDDVSFYFCGHDTPYADGISVNPKDCGLFRKLPEVHGAELINSELLQFHSRVNLPEVNFEFPARFDTLDSLIDVRYKTFQVGIGVASSLVSDTKSSRPTLDVNYDLIVTMLKSSISVYEFTKNVLINNQFDLVYVFNGRFCNHRALMCAAMESGVEVIFHERGANKFLYDLMSHMPHDLSHLQTKIKSRWEEHKSKPESIKLATSFYTERRNGHVHGWLSYTENQKRNLLPQIDHSKKIITFFSSSEDEFVSVGDLIKFVGWNSQSEAVNDLIDICKKHHNIQLFIRLHPHKRDKSMDDQNRWLDLAKHDNVNVISFNSDIDSYALIEASDLVISCGSTVGIEATFWGRPSISVGPTAYSELGACYLPSSKQELEMLISTDLMPMPKGSTLAYGYYMMTYGKPFKYYEPETLFNGKFLGVDLHKMPSNRLRWLRFKQILLKPFQIMKKIFYAM